MNWGKFSHLQERGTSWLPQIMAALLAIIVTTGIGAIILTAYFGVPMGDDYLAIKTFSNMHTWPSETWYSFTHTGRYLQSITASVAYGALRSHIASILPLVTIGGLYILIFLFARLANRHFKLNITPAHLHLLSVATLFALVGTGRSIDPHHLWLFYQPFFFSSAIVTYTFGILLYLSFVYFAITSKWYRRQPTLMKAIVLFFATYLLGLYNETTPATLLGLSALGTVALLTPLSKKIASKRAGVILLSTSVAANLFALLTMYFSPANIARRHSIASSGAVTNNLAENVIKNFKFTFSSAMVRPSDIILLIAIAMVFYYILLQKQRRSRIKPYVTLIAGIACIAAGILSLCAALLLVIIGYGDMSGIYPRTLLIPQFLFTVGILIFAIALLSWLNVSPKRRYVELVSLGVIVVGLVALTPHHIARIAAHITGVQDYNATWTSQDALLKSAATRSSNNTVYLDDSGAGIGDGFSVKCTGPYYKTTNWLNDGMESYYGIHSICAKSDLQKGQ